MRTQLSKMSFDEEGIDLTTAAAAVCVFFVNETSPDNLLFGQLLLIAEPHAQPPMG